MKKIVDCLEIAAMVMFHRHDIELRLGFQSSHDVADFQSCRDCFALIDSVGVCKQYFGRDLYTPLLAIIST